MERNRRLVDDHNHNTPSPGKQPKMVFGLSKRHNVIQGTAQRNVCR